MEALNPQKFNKVAILLNANAKKVTPRVRSQLAAQGEGIDIFYSTSLDDAQSITRRVLDQQYDLLLTGGGDGTIVQTIHELFLQTGRVRPQGAGLSNVRHLQAVPQAKAPVPAVGILKLGTGNALASLVGAGRYDQDVARIRKLLEEGGELATFSVPLCESEGQVFPFAGLGWDAAILNDYLTLKEASDNNAVSRALCKSVMGYLAAAFALTIPKVALNRMPEVEIRALSEASLIGPDGSSAKEFAPGAIIYRGPVSMVAFATTPYYGYEFKMFPFTSGLTDRFQLRVATARLPEVVLNLPSFWRGTYRGSGVLDFHCKRVTMSFSEPTPYQIGGDAKGTRETLTVGTSPFPVELLDLHPHAPATV